MCLSVCGSLAPCSPALSPSSGRGRVVARGLERGQLRVRPRALGEHADLLGAQTGSDSTFGCSGLQRGARNTLCFLGGGGSSGLVHLLLEMRSDL